MNLADAKQRRSAQQDKLGNRASILPGNRNTRQPQLETNASLFSARRGDGGARELMRTLGMVEEAGSDLVDYVQRDHAASEREKSAQGFADQQAGTVDPEMAEKSLGYRNAVIKGRTVTNFEAASREFDEELRGVIEQQDAPDLDLRQAEVSERIERFYRDFATDPDTGEIRDDYRSPAALRYLAETMQATRSEFSRSAMARIEQRFNEEALSHFQEASLARIRSTATFDIDEGRSLLPPTVTDEQVAEATLLTVSNGVDVLKAEGRFAEATALLAAVRGYANTPVNAGVPEAQGTGAGRASGRVSFDALARAVKWQESRGNPDAVSPKGALGTMQTMPGTLRDPGYGVKPARDDSPAELERVGRDYLKAMLSEYGGDYVLALAAYNAGPGNADKWREQLKGKGMKQKIAAIPFEETRNYVRNILSRTGILGKDGVAPAASQFRLQRPDADPVTLFEQTGVPIKIVGLDSLRFSPEQTARLNKLYEQRTAEMRADWATARQEEQGHNASVFALGIFGEGLSVTDDDIRQAVREGAVSPDDALTLFRMMRSEEEARENALYRAEAREDREAARQRDRVISDISSPIIAGIMTGRTSPAMARSDAMKAIRPLGDSAAQMDILRDVLAASNAMESSIANSAPARAAVRRLDEDIREDWTNTLRTHPGLRGLRQRRAVEEADRLLDQSIAFYSRRLQEGVPHEEAWSETTARFTPQLHALTPGKQR